MTAQRSSNTFLVQVDGRELVSTLQLALLDATIEDELNLPDSCELVFRDPLRSAIASGHLKLGAGLVVRVMSEAAPSGKVIFDGEITSLEAEVERDGVMTTIRGFDRLHRLQRGTHTETYLDMTYGDIASTVASRHDLSMGDTGTNRVVHDAVVQWNATDWEFLREIAARIGHEVVIVDGKLTLRPPPTASDAPPAGEVDGGDGRQLVVGNNILQLRTTISGGEQVSEVAVRGWDPTAKAAVESIVQAQSSADSAAAGIGAVDAAEALGGGTLVVASPPLRSAEVAGDQAASLAQQLGSSLAELDGVVVGNPDLHAGTPISLAGLGAPFDGGFVLTSCRHTYDATSGYRTTIRVSGRQNRTMLGLMNGSVSTSHVGHPVGVVPALVSDVDDPEALGRVKVTFPWLGERATSHWARVALAGAGKDRGLVVIPEVDDEVIVAFEHGDAREPVVLGGLWNGVDAPPVQAVESGEVVTRAFVSRTGHRIEFHDKDETVTLVTGDDQHRLVLDASASKITIESTGDIEISSQKSVAISSPQGMSLQCDGALELKGMGVTIDAGGGNFEAKGVAAKVSGSAQATLEGGATTTIKGATVQIN